MPQALAQLPNVYESVIRRVAKDSVDQLITTMRLPGETRVLMPGSAEAVPIQRGSFSDPRISSLNYPTDGRLLISFTEEVDEQTTLAQHYGPNEQLALFEDPVRSVRIYPMYRQVTMNLNMTYQAPSQAIAQRWLDEMRARASQMRAELVQKLHYHYAIPDGIMLLLYEVWQKIEASTAPLNVPFAEYLNTYLGRPTTTLDTISDSYPVRAVTESQDEVIGWFDFTGSPQAPEKSGDESGSFTATVNYSFIYQRPTHCLVRWPLVIHNLPIAKKFQGSEPYETFRQRDRRVSFLKGNLESFLKHLGPAGIPYVIHPETDDQLPITPDKTVLTFFSGLLAVSPEHPRRLFDISKVGAHTFVPYALEYCYQQRHTLFEKNRSPLVFRLYCNGELVSNNPLSFAEGTLQLQTERPLDITKMYHVQFGIVKNWRYLHDDTVQCLRRYPALTYLLLRALGIILGGAGCYEDLPLLGENVPRPPSTQCPGQGSLIGPPDQGGTWPWPWLPEKWATTPYPGYDPAFHKGKWPAGSRPTTACDAPSWPGGPHTPDEEGGGGSRGDGGGVIRNDDIKDAVEDTDGHQGGEIYRDDWSANTVMYAQLFAYQGAR